MKLDGLPCITFDAYASDYVLDPFVAFSGEIIELLRSRRDELAGVEPLTRSFRDAAVAVAKQSAPLLANLAIRAATAGVIRAADLKTAADAVSSAGEEIAGAASKAVEQQIESYQKQKDALAHFRTKLAEVAKLVHGQHGHPLTIVVDELDRCRPNFALELLERIKHLFEVPNVVFVLLVNRAQIESYVRTVYGAEVDAALYLQKFADLFIDLPAKAPSLHGRDWSLRTYFDYLLKTLEVKLWNHIDIVVQDLDFIGTHYGISLRDAEHVARIMALEFASKESDRDTLESHPLVPFFAVIKVKEPGLFARIRDEAISGEEAIEKLRLSQLVARSSSLEQGINLIRVSLMTAEEKKKLQAGDQKQLAEAIDRWARRERLSATVCRSLDRFSFSV